MKSAAPVADLARFGPHAGHGAVSLAEAQRYCRRLARWHYENFSVASLFVPRRLRQDFFNLYAYCRWSDDLADEIDDPQQSLELLDWWEQQLDTCFAGRPRHPVMIALGPTIRRHGILRQPLADLLVAFRQDQQVLRYETIGELLDYCRHSAQPVGRLVLMLGGCHDEDRGRRADSICTGLQLANFCQDVAGDWDRGRIYLPAESCRAAGYDESMFAARRCNDAFRRLLAAETDRAESYLRGGRSLVEQLPAWLARDVQIMTGGGLAILEAIRRVDYDVWSSRPRVGKAARARLLLQALNPLAIRTRQATSR